MLDVGTCTEKANGSMAKQRKKKKTFDIAEEIVELAEAPAVDQTCACSRCWCLALVPCALLLLQLASGLLYKPACLRARGQEPQGAARPRCRYWLQLLPGACCVRPLRPWLTAAGGPPVPAAGAERRCNGGLHLLLGDHPRGHRSPCTHEVS